RNARTSPARASPAWSLYSSVPELTWYLTSTAGSAVCPVCVAAAEVAAPVAGSVARTVGSGAASRCRSSREGDSSPCVVGGDVGRVCRSPGSPDRAPVARAAWAAHARPPSTRWLRHLCPAVGATPPSGAHEFVLQPFSRNAVFRG